MLKHDSWTKAHDIALVFLALAYTTDSDLSNAEVESISTSLSRWRPELTKDQVHAIVLEAGSVFFESEAEQEIVESVRSLGTALSITQRREVLEDAIRVAESDGVLLNSEQNLLSVLAGAWDIKATKDRLIDESSARLENDPEWSILHDIALLYIVMGHSADGHLKEVEISAMIDRLGEWETQLTVEEIRSILRAAIDYYSQGPNENDLTDSVLAIKEALPKSQRLIVLDDLVTIAKADGTVIESEKDIVESLSSAWNIDVRIAL